MACVWAKALAWDSACRLWLIADLFGLFVTISVAAFLVLKALKGQRRGLLPKTGRAVHSGCWRPRPVSRQVPEGDQYRD
jgi:hypothetical protein